MGVKPELAFDVCWEVYRSAREVLETKRGLSTLDWKEATKFLWRPDFRPRLNEYVADFALAGKAALEGAGACLAYGPFPLVLLGPRAIRQRPPFPGIERAKLGVLVGGSTSALWQGIAEPPYVPATQIFYKRRVGTIENKTGTAVPCPYRESTSPTRNSLPHSDDATRVFVARR